MTISVQACGKHGEANVGVDSFIWKSLSPYCIRYSQSTVNSRISASIVFNRIFSLWSTRGDPILLSTWADCSCLFMLMNITRIKYQLSYAKTNDIRYIQSTQLQMSIHKILKVTIKTKPSFAEYPTWHFSLTIGLKFVQLWTREEQVSSAKTTGPSLAIEYMLGLFSGLKTSLWPHQFSS